MTQFRVTEAAALLGVSDDTVRRWIEAGRLPAVRDHAGRFLVIGRDLAALAQEIAAPPAVEGLAPSSASNRLPGLVTGIARDGLVGRVEIQAGPFRVVSVMTIDALDALGLEVGSLAVATVTAAAVVVESPRGVA